MRRGICALLAALLLISPVLAAEESGLRVHWLEPGYELVRWAGTGRAMCVKDGKCGVVDLMGRSVYPCELDEAYPGEDNTILARKDGLWGAMNLWGYVWMGFHYPLAAMADEARSVYVRLEPGVGYGITDLEGNIVAPYQYWNGKDYSEWLAAMEDNNGLWGYLDFEGKTVIPHQYVFAESFRDGVAAVAKEVGQWGFIDREGNEVIPCEYDAVGYAGDGVLRLERDGTVSYVDTAGREVPAPSVPVPSEYREGLKPVERDGKWGYEDEHGALVVPCVYDTAGDFERGVAAVSLDGRWGFLENPVAVAQGEALNVRWLPGVGDVNDSTTEHIMTAGRYGGKGFLDRAGNYYPIPMGAEFSEYVSGGQEYHNVRRDGKYGAVDRWGNVVVPIAYENVECPADFITHGAAMARGENGLLGVVDQEGNWLCEPRYEWTYHYQNGRSMVYDPNRGWGFLDTEGREAIPCQFHSYTQSFGVDGLAVADYMEGYSSVLYGLIDREGNAVLPFTYGKIWRAGEGLFGVEDKDGMVALADGTGRFVTEFLYRLAYDSKGYSYGCTFVNGLAAAMDQNGLWGYLAPDGSVAIPFQYAYARDFDSEGCAEVGTMEESIVIDREGNKVRDYDSLDYTHHEGLRAVERSGDATSEVGAWGYEDRAGNLVVPYYFESAGDFKDGVALVKKDGVYGLLKNPLKEELVSPWAQEELDRARSLGLVPRREEDYATFPVTRLQFADLAVNLAETALGRTLEPAGEGRFTDTADPAARKAAAAGIVNGVGDGTAFAPEDAVTREQLAAMLYRTLLLVAAEQGDVRVPEAGDLSAFQDGRAVSGWAETAVSALAGAGILRGDEAGLLEPKEYTTVEQAVLLVLRAYE